jgi:hypothetical protein
LSIDEGGGRPVASTTSALSFEPVQVNELAAFGASQPDESGEVNE